MSKKRILIVGGVAGGASAAARARRLSEEAEIILFERGPYISFANCGLPYHIGGEITEREKLLVQTPESMQSRFNIDVRINSEVIKINKKNKVISVHNKVTDEQYEEQYDELILSPGAQAIKPPIPGIENKRIFTLRNIPDMDQINHFINEHDAGRAVVVGGGYIGLEMVEALRSRSLQVTLVELADQVMGPIDKEMAALLHQELQLNGVDLRLGVSVTEFNGQQNSLDIKLSNGDNLLTDIVILAIGVRPESTLAQDVGLEIGDLGGIVVDQQMRTSEANIYAVGDAVEVKEFVSGKSALIPLAGPANRQGRIAADAVFGRKTSYSSTQGTGICKVFSQTAGMVGLNEKLLQHFEIPYEKIYIHPSQHASYYPGATPISLKLLFAPDKGKILGAQAVGVDGVDKRIDVIAMAMRAGQTVFDLQEAELCYAPPYGSAKDAINYAGFAATHVINGDTCICHTADIMALDAKQQFLLDVRTVDECEMGMIDGAINIPLDDLRGRLSELHKDLEIIVYCRAGLRGYLACRILQQHGFNCRNLSGGYTTYKLATSVLLPMDERAKKIVPDVLTHIDACGLQCPGPIQQLKKGLELVGVGDVIAITTTDPGFVNDAPAWCQATGHQLLDVEANAGKYIITIMKSSDVAVNNNVKTDIASRKSMTVVLFSGDFDKAMAAFIIANGAASMGYEVTIFTTFWGLNVLRQHSPLEPVQKGFVERVLGRMMPRGADKLALSKMHMMGMGTKMIKGIMRKKQVASLPELIADAQDAGVNLVACSMTMDLMGIRYEELITGVDKGGVAAYLNQAGAGSLNLFI